MTMTKLQITLSSLIAIIIISACNMQEVSNFEHELKTGIAMATNTPTVEAVIAVPREYPVKLAWFYKAPADKNFVSIANNYQFFILSKGNEKDRDYLIGLGAHRPILQYVRFDAIMDPGSCTRKPWQNNAAFMPGDFCMIDSQHPDWFLLDSNGKRYTEVNNGENFVMMDPGNPGWRAYFLERLQQTQQGDHNWDGVFLDNVETTLVRYDQINNIPRAYQSDISYQKTVQGFVEYLHTNYFKPSGKLLFANIIARKDEDDWMNNITYLDGAMHEGWSIDWPNRFRSAETWESQMKLAEQTQASGRTILLISQGTQADLELQNFAFASYLLVNNGKAFFRYGNSQNYSESWLYNNYSIKLGMAIGPRFQNGDEWRRNFENGYVIVNPSAHTSKIHLGN